MEFAVDDLNTFGIQSGFQGFMERYANTSATWTAFLLTVNDLKDVIITFLRNDSVIHICYLLRYFDEIFAIMIISNCFCINSYCYHAPIKHSLVVQVYSLFLNEWAILQTDNSSAL